MTTHELIHGQWFEILLPRRPELPNFVIVCDYGDWSGFRTLEDCLKQVPESWLRHRSGFFRIEER